MLLFTKLFPVKIKTVIQVEFEKVTDFFKSRWIISFNDITVELPQKYKMFSYYFPTDC